LSFREYILQFTEKEVRPEVFNKAKKKVLKDTSVSKTGVFTRSKHIKIFNISVFLKTKIFIEYFKYNLIPNGAL
jgi:hypothetical protein